MDEQLEPTPARKLLPVSVRNHAGSDQLADDSHGSKAFRTKCPGAFSPGLAPLSIAELNQGCAHACGALRLNDGNAGNIGSENGRGMRDN